MFSLVKALFNHQSLSKEAFDAYFDRLPSNIKVSWFRDGEFIIGNIEADNEEYMTQAKSPKEFIVMVNDLVYTTYGIPRAYLSILKEARNYSPSEKEWARLNDTNVHRASFESLKVRKVV